MNPRLMNSRHLLPLYIAFVLGIALLNSLASLQDYQRGGGTRAWEPFLWEFSSALFMGPLSLAALGALACLSRRTRR